MSKARPNPLVSASNPLGPRDSILLIVLFLTLTLQLVTWSGLDGYQLADSVEYMERAHSFVRGEDVVDSRVIRSFGFSTLLTPFFAVAKWIGIEDHTAVVWLVRVFQLFLGLWLVLVCARIGNLLGGRRTGLLTAFVVGVNPVFLQFSVSPLADIAGSLGVALALEGVLGRGLGFRGGLRIGLLMGFAMLMAYKTVPLSLMMMAVVLLRDRRSGVAPVAGMALAVGACVLVQASLDRIVYGVWGASILGYFGENVVGIIGRLLAKTGLDQYAIDLYGWYYETVDIPQKLEGRIQQIQANDWYLMHLPEMVVWPVLFGLALGLARALFRANWTSTLILLVTAGFVFLLHQKGSKEFRLWLPLLATLGPMAGWGLAWLAGDGSVRVRTLLTLALLASSVWFSFDVLGMRNTRAHSGYWHALDYIEEQVALERASDPELGHAKVASTYHWAVFLRSSADIQLKKLPNQIDAWKAFDEDQKLKAYGALREQDWFVVHLPILTDPGHRELTYRVNAWFQVEAVFYERAFEDLGPVLVMRRRASEGLAHREKTLFELEEGWTGEQALELARELGNHEPIRMVKIPHREDLWLLGHTYESLPGDGHGWLSTWWYNPQRFLADYTLVTRLTTHDERNSWQANERPTWGVFPTNEWKPGTLVRDSRLVVAARDPYAWQEAFQPLGGPYRRGDYMPAFLWIDLATFQRACVHCGEPFEADHACAEVLRDPALDSFKQVSGRLERAHLGAEQPLRIGEMAGARTSPEGWRWSGDDLTLVGRFFMPVHEAAVVADDGKPIPD